MAGNVVEIRGLDALIQKMQDGARVQRPAKRFLLRATMTGEASAKKAAPVDTGHLRRSITHRVDGHTVGRFGTNAPYGPHVEYGTRAHWPPVGALGGWARRHGTTAGAVAFAISQNGTKAQPFMTPAVKEVEAAIPALSSLFMAELEAGFSV